MCGEIFLSFSTGAFSGQPDSQIVGPCIATGQPKISETCSALEMAEWSKDISVWFRRKAALISIQLNVPDSSS